MYFNSTPQRVQNPPPPNGKKVPGKNAEKKVLLSLEKVILLVYNHILIENIKAASMDKAKIIELINQGD
jgi:hypothetical protein